MLHWILYVEDIFFKQKESPFKYLNLILTYTLGLSQANFSSHYNQVWNKTKRFSGCVAYPVSTDFLSENNFLFAIKHAERQQDDAE